MGHILIASVDQRDRRDRDRARDDSVDARRPKAATSPMRCKYGSVMDAITRGTTDGLRLAVNVGAMLVVLVSLIALVNAMIATFVGRR